MDARKNKILDIISIVMFIFIILITFSVLSDSIGINMIKDTLYGPDTIIGKNFNMYGYILFAFLMVFIGVKLLNFLTNEKFKFVEFVLIISILILLIVLLALIYIDIKNFGDSLNKTFYVSYLSGFISCFAVVLTFLTTKVLKYFINRGKSNE